MMIEKHQSQDPNSKERNMKMNRGTKIKIKNGRILQNKT